MGMLVDTCRIFQFGLYVNLIRFCQFLLLWWVTPASLYFSAGWELRLRRTVAALCFTLFGLFRLFVFMRHTPSLSEVFFGFDDCPPQRAETITSYTWTALLQVFSAFTWTPLSWLSRLLTTESTFVIIKHLKLAVLLPVQLMRGLIYSVTALIIGAVWLVSWFGVPLYNLFILPFTIFTSFWTLWLLFLLLIADETELPPWSRVALSDTTALLRVSFSPRHALQVAGRIFATVGYFGCRDRWFRRDALQAGIREAVIATLPGLIGPIGVDQEDITDAVSAVRGLSNRWTDLDEKQRLLDDKHTLVYTLSYKHIPVWEHIPEWEGEKMIRLSEQRAKDILRKVLSTAKEHGYRQVMLWCDGASVAGVPVDRSWVDIGLLPYTLYRTFRIETYVNGECLTENRLWLELEKGLSELTCGMDVIEEYVHEGGVNWEPKEALTGQWHKAMAAVLRVSARLAQGVYSSCAVSRDEDRTEIRAWARKVLRRSGLQEMNEGLGWSEEPAADRRAKAVLMRITTLKLRTKDQDARGEVAWVGRGTDFGDKKEELSAGSTQFWLELLGFESQEIADMENEEMEFFSAQFVEERTGRWEMVVVNLQGEYFVNMVAIRNVEVEKQGDLYGWLLLTNSQVEKASDVKEWVQKIVEEIFSTQGHKCMMSEVEHDFVEDKERDTPVVWFSELMGIYADWQHDFAARRRARMAAEADLESSVDASNLDEAKSVRAQL